MNKPLNKSRDSNMSGVTGNTFLLGFAFVVVVVRGNIAIVHADCNDFLSSEIFVG